jgi:hypothetical protein
MIDCPVDLAGETAVTITLDRARHRCAPTRVSDQQVFRNEFDSELDGTAKQVVAEASIS